MNNSHRIHVPVDNNILYGLVQFSVLFRRKAIAAFVTLLESHAAIVVAAYNLNSGHG